MTLTEGQRRAFDAITIHSHISKLYPQHEYLLPSQYCRYWEDASRITPFVMRYMEMAASYFMLRLPELLPLVFKFTL